MDGTGARRDSADSTLTASSVGSDGSGVSQAAADAAASAAVSASATARTPTAEELKRADALKEDGNKLFSAGKYTGALAAYSEAIDVAPSAPLLCNRAFAHLKLESYGAAITDATAALALDSTFIKALYRRGSAYLALGRHAQARADFRAVVRVRPDDADAKAKLEECEKAIRKQAFEAAIAVEAPAPLSQRLDVASIVVDASYQGPRLPSIPEVPSNASQCASDDACVNAHGISLGFVKAAMAEFKAQRVIHKRYVCEILIRLKKLLTTYKALVHVPFPEGAARFNVCGDTHGQYYDTLNIFEINGLPSPTNPYLFNGDFVDRGSFSVENVLTLFMWKLLYPDQVHLTRGNHETRNMNKMYGFDGEVKAKYDQVVLDLFAELFCALPLAVVIDRKAFVVHGGLFQEDGVTLDDIAAIDRFREPPESGLMSDILWSDPQPFPGRGPSKRGVGQSFGPDVTSRFLDKNGLSLVIRSHEVMDEGYQVIHNGKLITVFSAPNYCDQMNNKGGIVHLDRECNPTFTSFAAVPHPPVRPMAYAGGMMSMFGL